MDDILNKAGILPIAIAAVLGIDTFGVFAQDGAQPGLFDGSDDTLVATVPGYALPGVVIADLELVVADDVAPGTDAHDRHVQPWAAMLH